MLRLTYTANDMAPFARDMGYASKPFAWDEADRARRRARLDALYFMLYFPSGTKAEIETLRDTAQYIFSTFPIVRAARTSPRTGAISRATSASPPSTRSPPATRMPALRCK